MRRHIIAPVTAGVLLALAGTAQAATKTTTFTVTASVAKNCLVTAGNLALGAFDGTNNLAATSDISVRCTNGTTFAVALSPGGSGSFASRTMAGPGTDTLSYNLYTGSTYASVWGDGTSSTLTVAGTGAGMSPSQAQTLTVYGRLLASANTDPVEAGSYTDTITATVTY